MSLKLRWLGTSCFQMVLSENIHILLDPHLDHSQSSPIISDHIDRCDYLFLTHGHWDHVLDVGKLAKRFAPPIFCNQTTAAAIIKHQQVDEALIHCISVGNVVEETGFQVEVLPGVHVNAAREYKRQTGRDLPGEKDVPDPLERLKTITRVLRGSDQFPEEYPLWHKIYAGGEQLNFIIQGTDGQRIYVAGTYPEPEIIASAETARASITLLQCMSAGKLAGIEQETADLALASGCRTVIPQHHDPLFKDDRKTDLTRLRHILSEQSGIVFLEMTPGEWYTFEDGMEHKKV